MYYFYWFSSNDYYSWRSKRFWRQLRAEEMHFFLQLRKIEKLCRTFRPDLKRFSYVFCKTVEKPMDNRVSTRNRVLITKLCAIIDLINAIFRLSQALCSVSWFSDPESNLKSTSPRNSRDSQCAPPQSRSSFWRIRRHRMRKQREFARLLLEKFHSSVSIPVETVGNSDVRLVCNAPRRPFFLALSSPPPSFPRKLDSSCNLYKQTGRPSAFVVHVKGTGFVNLNALWSADTWGPLIYTWRVREDDQDDDDEFRSSRGIPERERERKRARDDSPCSRANTR